LDLKESIIFIIIAHSEAATDMKVSWYSFKLRDSPYLK
jgi:hypothetical protein